MYDQHQHDVDQQLPKQITPWENFMSRKINFRTDMKTYFGQVVQVINSNINNSMEPRTSAGITLLHHHNANGTVKFFDLNSLKIISRDNYNEVPLSDDIIKRINEIAAKE